ncbi:MAG: hypothetical protein WCF19_02290 [Chlamydiales bacterium]
MFILVFCNYEFSYNHGVVFNMIIKKHGDIIMNMPEIRGSAIFAKPSLQLANEKQASKIIDTVTKVNHVQLVNDHAAKTTQIAIALFGALGVLAIVGTLLATGIVGAGGVIGCGIAAIGVGVFVAYQAINLLMKVNEKKKIAPDSEAAFRGAKLYAMNNVIDQHNKRQNGIALLQLPHQQQNANAYGI